MNRSAGRVRDAISDHAVAGRSEIGAAHAGVFFGAWIEERSHQVGQPVRVWVRVIFKVGDNVSGGRGKSKIACVVQPTILPRDNPIVAVLPAGQGAAESTARSADH